MLVPAFVAIAASVILAAVAKASPAIARHGPNGILGSRVLTNNSGCRCFPGDTCWPTLSEWNAFNSTLAGNLIATIPVASPCHDSVFGPFDGQRCAEIQSTWFFPESHFETSSSIMAPYFTNNSCNPFLPRSAPCTIGNYVSYAVNASGTADFQKTVDFAQRHNIRLTIRNTGHDYNGKATAAGAIAIWTHHMKAMTTFDYSSPEYTGKAIKMAAGVQAVEAYRYAHQRGLVVVGGDCPTVGIAGGYTQGGGHGPLASKFGLAADQALEWEVVTATGKYLIASPSRNADLYWALSGGGGGTFGIVASLTVKAWPDLMTSAANLTFSSGRISQDSFWNVVETFQGSLPSMVNIGIVAVFELTNESFTVMPVQGPGVPLTELQQLLTPTLTRLNEENISYSTLSMQSDVSYKSTDSIALAFNIDEFPTFYDSYKSYNPPWKVSQYQIGGRLIPRSLVINNLSALVRAERRILTGVDGVIMTGVSVNVSSANPAMNSVNPYWRTALFDAVIGT